MGFCNDLAVLYLRLILNRNYAEYGVDAQQEPITLSRDSQALPLKDGLPQWNDL